MIFASILFLLEKDRDSGVHTFPDALYAVGLFMVTVGYRPDTLGSGGRLIGLASSLLGLVLFGTLVSLIFYSLED